jgi:predicted permease
VLGLYAGSVAVEGEQKAVEAHFVTANFFDDLGATPLIGRLLDPSRDEASSAEPVVVLTYGFWQSHFGADPLVAGKTVRLNGKLATVVGVAASNFSGLSLSKPGFWVPISQEPYFAAGSQLLTDFDGSSVQMWGRLQPGLAPAAAEQELRSLAGELRRTHPSAIWKDEGLVSQPGGYTSSLLIGTRSGSGSGGGNSEIYPILGLLSALCLLILIVACGNLGSLLLARGVARQREMSIRVAVGAGRARLIRQLFTESLVLALLGSALGLAVGWLVLRGLLILTGVPGWIDPTPDWRVMLFALAAGVASAILFGLTPTLQVARQRHRATLTRQFLVGAQIAASCVLLIVAGLLGRALTHAMSADPGFEYRQVLAINPRLSQHGYTSGQARTYLDTLRGRLVALPGVESVALAQTPPLGHVSISAGIDIEGRHVTLQILPVDTNFFGTMKIPLLLGRNFASNETRAAVVSDSFARKAWPGKDPLGRTFNIDGDYTVVGVAGGARTTRIEDSDSVEVYVPLGLDALPSAYVLVRTARGPEDLARSASTIARGIDPNTFPEAELLKTQFTRKLEGAEYSVVAVSTLGFFAQLLACLGIAGVVAYAVSQRTKEIGIRMALGADPAHVLSVVLRQFFIPVTAGLLVGLAGAAILSKFLRGQLYGISNLDPVTYLLVIGVFVITVGVAALLPARRALGVDPLQTLRYE